MLERAAESGPHDLIVMPEAVAMLCYPDDRPDFTYYDVAEDVPGPTTDEASRTAKTHHVNVVIGLIDRREDGCQNLAVVIDRSGKIVGAYEKLHEPEICIREQAALEATGPAPVFDLDFGRIGIFICWDNLYPELSDELKSSGADMLVLPHLMSFANDRGQAKLVREHARRNRIPLVMAGMRDAHNHNDGQDGLWPTAVLDADGSVIAQTDKAGSDLVSCAVLLRSGR